MNGKSHFLKRCCAMFALICVLAGSFGGILQTQPSIAKAASKTAVKGKQVKIKVKLAGKKVGKGKAGVKIGKKYLVDAKAFSKTAKLSYSYKKSSGKVMLKKSGMLLTFSLGKKKVARKAAKGKKSVKADIAPRKIGSKVYVSAKTVAAQFGYKKKLSYKKKTLIIKKKAGAVGDSDESKEEYDHDYYTEGTMPELPTVENSLPRVSIVIENGYRMMTATREAKKIQHNAYIQIDDGAANPTVTLEKTKITLSGRGNSTFYEIPEDYPKLPMKFKFDKGVKKSVCGMPEGRSWDLLAELYDRTLMRNLIAQDFAAALDGLDYVVKCVPVEVYVNGDYRGVYTLAQNIGTNENSINVDTTGDEPGFLVERCQRSFYEAIEDYMALPSKDGVKITDLFFNDEGEASTYGKQLLNADPTKIKWADILEKYCYTEETKDWNLVGTSWKYKSPDVDELTATQKDYISKSVLEVHYAIKNASWSNYKDMIDMDSFVDFYLLNFYLMNTDLGFSSVYMYKPQGASSKLYMGPAWDYDIYIGNGGQNTNDQWMVTWVPWLKELWEQSWTFKSQFKARWQEISNTIVQTDLIDRIDHYTGVLQSAQARNFERWDVLNVRMDLTKGRYPTGTWEGEVEYLKNWLTRRKTFFDTFLG